MDDQTNIFSKPPKYVIDTDSLIKLKEDYRKSVFPGVWLELNKLVNIGLIISVELVLYELSEISDEIFEWAKEHKLMFRPLNNQVQEIAKDILFKYPNLINLKKKFNADPFVIAFAKVHSCVVVLKKIQAEIPIKLKYPMYVKL